MAKNPISNKADNDRIQIRSFWISERKAPYVYSFLKKQNFLIGVTNWI
ncbi:hypothetical protein SEEH5757_02307 [Salmonella enterica subsp. enterica serovar Heidelberg str. N15757]|uniref:Uncharacterized protein n=1 Tax=Escherichia coli TaxID=562 RepID=A0A343J0S7_ECOLX|nr:hypothetical protein ECSA44_05801 [Escherichia coli]EYI28533.1 hypothetical protein SEEH5757_02307 [Salmonella enterica subsp. enterica serovar Heidelberg str. N15757]EYI56990.1 hypothetical protein SEEH2507_04108 [Salmonella enterica subsp. enterica serovar Heidelberg str. 32507]